MAASLLRPEEAGMEDANKQTGEGRKYGNFIVFIDLICILFLLLYHL